MGKLFIIPETATGEAKDALVMDRRRRPLAVMEAYSLMALRVDRLDDCAAALGGARFTFAATACGIEVTFEDARRRSDLFLTLARENIRWEMADIVDGVYQG